MKKLFLLIFLIMILASVLNAFPITNYYTRIQINKDASINITESITADFTGDPHHGIFRDIPLSGKDKFGNNYKFRVGSFSVTDAQGNTIPFKQTKKYGGIVDLRIGDPDTEIETQQIYIISYKLTRAIHFFDKHDELYWNIVGNTWEVPIQKASCDVILPTSLKPSDIRTVAYTGYYGSTTSDALTSITSPNTINIKSTRQLNPGEALTVVVGWPKGVINQPSTMTDVIWFLQDNLFYFLPVIFAAGLFLLWKKQGKDPDIGRVVTVQYSLPDKLNPAEVGTLIDEIVDMRDISASIVDLAVRKFLTIRETEKKGFLSSKKEYTLNLVRPYAEIMKDSQLSKFEKSLIDAIFNGLDFAHMEDLQNRFYIHIPKLKKQLYDSMLSHKYFTHRPDETRSSYQSAGFVVAVLGFILLIGVSFVWGLSILLCGIMLIIAARLMPRKTRIGKEALIGIKGFEEYLSRAEKQEIDYQERNNIFQKFLPYAMALGIAEKWARTFEGLDIQPPDWYSGSDMQTFSTLMFVNNLNMASSNWTSSMISTPRTQGGSGSFFSGGSGFGGGFSGGGGGGGGGGGW